LGTEKTLFFFLWRPNFFYGAKRKHIILERVKQTQYRL
jgi:hypothetical protein